MAYDKFLTVAGNELFNEDGEKVAEFNKDRIEYDSSKLGGGSSADAVSFDPSLTELVATNVQNAIEEVADESHLAINALTANDGMVFMDYHDGKYGINTDESKGADTFIPFKSLETIQTNYTMTTETHGVVSYNFGYVPKFIAFLAKSVGGKTNKCIGIYYPEFNMNSVYAEYTDASSGTITDVSSNGFQYTNNGGFVAGSTGDITIIFMV